MPSKVNFGHPKWPINLKWPEMRSSDFQRSKMATGKILILYRSEMARIAIECEFLKSKMADRSEMARNAFESEFLTSKMAAGSQFVKKNPKKIKVAYQSEMARNAIESEFRTSKMADVSHFVQN